MMLSVSRLLKLQLDCANGDEHLRQEIDNKETGRSEETNQSVEDLQQRPTPCHPSVWWVMIFTVLYCRVYVMVLCLDHDRLCRFRGPSSISTSAYGSSGSPVSPLAEELRQWYQRRRDLVPTPRLPSRCSVPLPSDSAPPREHVEDACGQLA